MKRIHIFHIFKVVMPILVVLSTNWAFAQKPKVDLEYNFSVGSYSGTVNYFRKDIQIPGMDLAPEVVFNFNGAKVKKDWGYGNGWTFTYGMLYELDTANNVVVYKNDGSKNTFTRTEDGFIAPSSARYDELEEYASNRYRLKVKKINTLYYYFDDPEHKKLTAIEDLNGNKAVLTYSDSVLAMVTDPVGRKIKFRWNEDHLTSVIEENTSQKRVFTYSYDENGNMIKVTNPMGNTLTYRYDEDSRMTFFTDENANPIKIDYKSDQAVKKVSTCMHTVAFTYDVTNRKTFVLENVNGEKIITSYRYDEKGRNIERKGNCCGYHVKMEYDDKDNVIKRVDGNSSAMVFVYDQKGNVKKKTNGAGGEVKTDYDPKTNRLLSRTDELGNTTSYTYDQKGNVTQIEYPLGITEAYKYNQYGNVIEHTDKNDNVTTYKYDQYQYFKEVVYPDNSSVRYKYDALGNLLEEVDENGYKTSYDYDKMNRPVKQTDPLGNTSTITYDAKGNRIKIKDFRGNETRFAYDPMDRLVGTTTPMGITTTKEYDNRGNVVKETDGKGLSTIYTYNSFDLVTSVTDPAGNKKFFAYNAAGKKLEESDKMGNSMVYKYDNSGRLVKKTDPMGNSYTYSYNVKGQVISETDGDGYTTTYQYDALGRKTKIVDPMGNEEARIYDNKNNIVRKIDKNGNETEYTYDKKGRKIKIEAPLNDVIEYTYDDAGNRLKRTMGEGVVYHYEYDKLNRKVKETSPEGKVTTYEYDAVGNQVSTTLPNGNVITQEYDKDNRLLKKTDSEGTLVAYTYDNNNLVIKEVDGDGITTIKRYNSLNLQIEEQDDLGRIKRTEYNKNGLPARIIDANQQVTTLDYNEGGVVTKITRFGDDVTLYKFDARGNLLSVTDPKGNTTSFSYDGMSRKLTTTFPDGSIEEYVYDANGNVTKRKTPSGTISYEYDALDRQVKRIYPDGVNSTYSYDEMSRMIKATNDNVTVHFEFDKDSRLLKESVGGKEISYAYNTADRKVSITYPSGTMVTEEMDYAGRAEKILYGGTEVASMTYAGNQLVQKTYNNGQTTAYSYNAVGRVKEISVNFGLALDLQYTYDNKGNVLSKRAGHHPEFSEAYAYNTKGQLTFYQKGALGDGGITDPQHTSDFSYDLLGNRVERVENGLTTTYATNENNQYTAVQVGEKALSPTYFSNGNLKSYGSQRYDYDAEGRLLSAGKVSYTYDALGRRYQRITDKTTTTYYYYKDQLITEVDNQGKTVEYIFNSTSGKPVATISGNGMFYYHHNTLGSVVAMSDAAGDVIEYYEYTSYGLLSVYNASFDQVQEPAITQSFFYARSCYDATTELYYMKSRDYHPGMGRFLQRDPILFKGSTLNLYEYVHSNPVNYIDPYGLKDCVSHSTSRSIAGFPKRTMLGRAFGGSGGVTVSGGIDFTTKVKVCEKCCSKNGDKYKGSVSSANTSISGSLSASINGLAFFPASRVLMIAVSRLGIDIFVGIRIAGSASGSLNIKNDCGDFSGGGTVTYKISSTGEISAGYSGGNGNRTDDVETKVNISGTITGSFEQKGTLSYSNNEVNKECETKWGGEAQVSFSVQYTWMGWTFNRSGSLKRDLGSGSNDGCPPGL